MDVKLTKIQNIGNDILLVIGNINGEEVQAHGWVSAINNHYDDFHYLENGHRLNDALHREMTEEEKREYCKRLLVDKFVSERNIMLNVVDLDIL